MIYAIDIYYEKRNAAGIRSKYDKIIVKKLLHTFIDHITNKSREQNSRLPNRFSRNPCNDVCK